MYHKTAVVLFNLGGPGSPDEIQPFLYSLFSDPAILTLPQPFRSVLASLITRRRLTEARHIYAQLGGSSPLLKNTRAQAEALERILNECQKRPFVLSVGPEGTEVEGSKSCISPFDFGAAHLRSGRTAANFESHHTYKTFVAMRHAHPHTETTFAEVQAYNPDEIVLLPLYPQYSTTTTESSWKAWREVSKGYPPTRCVCCYPTHPGFIEALTNLTLPIYEQAKAHGKPYVLLTAHGLPEKTIRKGDPYQRHVEQSAQHLIEKLQLVPDEVTLCYQSRVGPLRWIGPSTEDEVKRAATQKRPIVVVPLSFVSEHSETLVELDVTYKNLASSEGCPAYFRVDTVQTHPLFIRGLASLVRDRDRPPCKEHTYA